tara:strand:- start:955 stop:1608 length:654 start_codon:yes stop_codon:yes gene_type:complete
MSTTKRVSGDYNISSVDVSTDNVIITTHTVTVNGNLTVTGTTTSVETTNTEISDNTITLNNGESGAGVTAGTSGIEVDRGSSANVELRWNESSSYWELTEDGSTYTQITTSAGAGIASVVADTTPQLGGNLDINGFNITSARSNEDIVINPNGTGKLEVASELKLLEVGSDPSAVATHTFVYAKNPGAGQTGLYVANTTRTDEVASNKRARLYGLIF